MYLVILNYINYGKQCGPDYWAFQTTNIGDDMEVQVTYQSTILNVIVPQFRLQ